MRADVFLADGPARTTLRLVGNTWPVVVITALGDGPMRYSALLGCGVQLRVAHGGHPEWVE